MKDAFQESNQIERSNYNVQCLSTYDMCVPINNPSEFTKEFLNDSP
jgi:hypothetical protein